MADMPKNKRLAAPQPKGGSINGNNGGAATPGVSFNPPVYKGPVKTLRKPAR